ncbi:MAG: type 1 glutamine amidotransferase [Burkholderiaceae bacterium]
MRPIVIVQHEADAGPGHFETHLLQRNMPYQMVRVYAGDPVPVSAASYSGICSLGGSMSANDALPWIDEELALLRDADRREIPIIGHCLGGQLLAKAFGAPVTRSAMQEIGWSDVEVDDIQLAREWIGSAPVFNLFQWHGDTFALPADARRFLTSPLCANQAFVIDRGHHAHLGMQFHVEMTPSLVNGWVGNSDGQREIGEAFERQGGVGVQRAEEIVLHLDQRTQRMSRVANRIYDRWLRGLRR